VVRTLGASRSVLARRRYHSLHLRVDDKKLAHGRLGTRRVTGGESLDDPGMVTEGRLAGTVTGRDRTARDLQGGGNDAGEVFKHAIAGGLDEQ